MTETSQTAGWMSFKLAVYSVTWNSNRWVQMLLNTDTFHPIQHLPVWITPLGGANAPWWVYLKLTWTSVRTAAGKFSDSKPQIIKVEKGFILITVCYYSHHHYDSSQFVPVWTNSRLRLNWFWQICRGTILFSSENMYCFNFGSISDHFRLWFIAFCHMVCVWGRLEVLKEKSAKNQEKPKSRIYMYVWVT